MKGQIVLDRDIEPNVFNHKIDIQDILAAKALVEATPYTKYFTTPDVYQMLMDNNWQRGDELSNPFGSPFWGNPLDVSVNPFLAARQARKKDKHLKAFLIIYDKNLGKIFLIRECSDISLAIDGLINERTDNEQTGK